MEKLIIWIVLTLVPLIPTYVTHKFLESNSSYKAAHNGIKLGGAIAAYFILVGTAFTTYEYMYDDPLYSLRKELSGEWECSSTIIETDNEDWVNQVIESSMDIHVNDSGKISLTGSSTTGTFSQAEEVIVTQEKLIYIFNAPISGATGITWLTFRRGEDDINGLFGHWVVSGKTGRGSITCFREIPPIIGE